MRTWRYITLTVGIHSPGFKRTVTIQANTMFPPGRYRLETIPDWEITLTGTVPSPGSWRTIFFQSQVVIILGRNRDVIISCWNRCLSIVVSAPGYKCSILFHSQAVSSTGSNLLIIIPCRCYTLPKIGIDSRIGRPCTPGNDRTIFLNGETVQST